MLYPPEIEMEDKPCPMECEADDYPLFKGRDRLHGLPGEYTIVKCRSCGLMRTNPRPTQTTIGYYYPEDYGPYKSTHIIHDLTSKKPPSALKRMALKILDRKARRLPLLKPGRMLEIGCASGSFLRQMDNLGWQVEGLEFSEKAATEARALGYPVYGGALETAPKPKEPYDLIIGWMVFEHLHDPVNALQKLNQWTKPKGMLVLSIPDAGSFEWNLFKDAGYAIQLPTHLYHYTIKTLRQILRKGGWDIHRVIWENNPNNFLQSLRYICIDRNWIKGAEYLLDIVESRRHRYFHLFLGTLLGMFHASGRMIVWARRI